MVGGHSLRLALQGPHTSVRMNRCACNLIKLHQQVKCSYFVIKLGCMQRAFVVPHWASPMLSEVLKCS